ncbi:MAG TPA: hypothetical protein VM658_17390 [bacterium]|nr:hypothetical protein [bacterium]
MKHMKSKAMFAAALAAAIIMAGCAKPVQEKKPETDAGPKHEYKDIKPAVYDVPPGVAAALPGLLNDKVYVYREIAPTLNLVAYAPNYSLPKAPLMAAQAFEALAAVPEFRRGIEFWIIQIQPPAGAEQVPQKPGEAAAPQNSEVFVWGVKPSEVDEYLKSKDLLSFISNSEYLLVNDENIPKGEARAKLFPGLAPPPPQPAPGDTAGQGLAPAPPAPAPQEGDTANQ